MKYIHITESPLKIYGLEMIDRKSQTYRRVFIDPESEVNDTAKKQSLTPTGGRVRFRTDADKIYIRATMSNRFPDPCIPPTGTVGCDVYVGTGLDSSFRGVATEASNEKNTYDERVKLRLNSEGKEMRDVTINLPRNHPLIDMEIGFPDDAQLLEPLPYSTPGKICYYGSSITAGGCASRPGNAYTSVVSRWLDIDYSNYGFSGSALGELYMADKIIKGNFDYFVLDYDYNAPTVEHLANTHEPFFKKVREACPNMPIIIMTRPNFFSDPTDSAERRDVVMRTYTNARAAGDKNVYFIDGESFFTGTDISSSTVDCVHPNDHGFHLMSLRVYDILKKIIK